MRQKLEIGPSIGASIGIGFAASSFKCEGPGKGDHRIHLLHMNNG